MDYYFNKCTSDPTVEIIKYVSNKNQSELKIKFGTYMQENTQYVVYEMHTNQLSINDDHPFKMLDKSDIENEDGLMSTGNICAHNIVTESLLKMIVMNITELELHSGLTTALHYRAALIHSLGLFWD